MSTRCITFANHKGGTGKTTSCINIAGELARQGNRVLVVDLDPQGSATSGLGINAVSHGIQDVLWAYCEGKEFPPDDMILKTGIENIDIIPASLDLAGITTIIHQAEAPWGILKNVLEGVNGYEYILIDSPAGHGYLSTNAIFASDKLIVPLDPGAFSANSVRDFSIILKDIRDELKKDIEISVIINTFRGSVQNKLSSILSRIIPSHLNPIGEIEDKIKLFFRLTGLKERKIYVVPYSKRIYEAQRRGIPLSHHSPNHSINRIYQKIIQDI